MVCRPASSGAEGGQPGGGASRSRSGKRGPAIAQAFDAEGKPSKAAEGWARGCGITVDQAERLTTDKGEWLLYRAHVKGESTEALLPNMIASSLAKLPIETDALGRV